MKIQLEMMKVPILTFGIQLKFFEKEVRQNEKGDSHKMKFDSVIQTPELSSDFHVSFYFLSRRKTGKIFY